MRRLLNFPCAGETLFATFDEGASHHAVLIVSGGTEIRAGAHGGMAALAGALAAAGHPVLRPHGIGSRRTNRELRAMGMKGIVSAQVAEWTNREQSWPASARQRQGRGRTVARRAADATMFYVQAIEFNRSSI